MKKKEVSLDKLIEKRIKEEAKFIKGYKEFKKKQEEYLKNVIKKDKREK